MTLTVDLWVWPLDIAAEARELLARYLSEDERERAARFVFARDRDRYVVGRGRLRRILSERCDVPPGKIRFSYGAHGKPAIAGGPNFNLSHSGGWAALALCAGNKVELGLDIEVHRPIDESVVEHYFSATERIALDGLAVDLRETGFFRCWTRKEAVLKAIGSGMALPLDAFDVTLDPRGPARITRLDIDAGTPRDWRLIDIALGPAFSGALALRTPERTEVTLRGGVLPLPAVSDSRAAKTGPFCRSAGSD